MSASKKVAIIGSGLIGRAWTIIFTSFGHRVYLFDVNADCLASSLGLIRAELESLCARKLARGSLSLEERLALISTTSSLEACVKGADHIQECVFEDADLKRKLFADVDKMLDDHNTTAAICSSTSVQLPSSIFSGVVKHKSQCLVAHPVNPPTYVRLVELVPCAETRQEVVLGTRSFMESVGQKPVVLNREISGFALNRLQYAVFQQAYKLVADGIMTPRDVDTVVTDGLGPRYAFIGPWMTSHLNANGIADYWVRYGDCYYDVSKESQSLKRVEGEAAQKIYDDIFAAVPLDQLNAKKEWRDQCLLELALVKGRVKDPTEKN